MYPTATRKQALALIARGRSMNSVSKELGISRAAIRDWRDHGVEPKHQEYTCFVCSRELPPDEAAYCLLLGYYLGDGCISRVRSTYSLRVSCDKTYPDGNTNATSRWHPGSASSSQLTPLTSCAACSTPMAAE